MNRRERRLAVKRDKADKTKLMKDEKTDRTNAIYCWRHPLQLENIDNPTESDKKKIESVRLQPFKRLDTKTGEKVLGRSCPRCGNTVYVSEQKIVADVKIEGYTDNTDARQLEGLGAL